MFWPVGILYFLKGYSSAAILPSSIALLKIARKGRKYIPTVVLDLSAATSSFHICLKNRP